MMKNEIDKSYSNVARAKNTKKYMNTGRKIIIKSMKNRAQQEKWMATKRHNWISAVESSHCNFQFKAGNILLFQGR